MSQLLKLKPYFSMENFFLLLLILVNSVSIFGYLVFALNPANLSKYPWSIEIFNNSFSFFARLQIVLAFLSIGFFLLKKGLWIKEFVSVFLITLLMELGGTILGIPFGKYEYSDLLGWKLFGHVPFLIPISWFFMSFASYSIAVNLEKNNSKGKFASTYRVLISSLLLTTWDFALDPAMSHLSPFWIWEHPGIYFGTPLINLFGWFLTGLFVMIAFELFKTNNLIAKFSKNEFTWQFIFYLVNVSLPIGMVICSGLWEPVLFTLIVLFGIFYRLPKKRIIKFVENN